MLKMIKILLNLATAILLSAAVALPAQATKLVVGGKNFTEQRLLSEITTLYLGKLGYDVDLRSGMGSSVLRKAQVNGQIDLYWEYTGTSLIVYNKVKEKLSPAQTYQRVKELDAKIGLVWLNPSPANDTYAFAMRKLKAKKLGISTISDLAKSVNDNSGLAIAVNAEFYARSDGLKPLEKTYGFKFPRDDIKRMASGLTYTALKDKQVDIALVFATDGRIPAFHFVVLKDNLDFFPSYAITPVVRADTLKKNPHLAAQLNKLSPFITDAQMSHLNALVDVNRQSVEKVSKDFLVKAGLI